jgi:uncharacterized HAD superfamily protein
MLLDRPPACLFSDGNAKEHDLNVALDLDGVLADLHSVLLEKFSQVVNRRVTADMITRWDIAESFKPGLASSYDSAWEYYRAEQISSYEANVGLLVDQIRKSASVDIVTAHAESSRSNIERWLALNHVGYRKLMLVGEGDGTHKLSMSHQCNVFIDDNPNLAQKALKGTFVFLYSQPWNQQVRTSDRDSIVLRIHSLREVPELLDRISVGFR